MKGLTTFVSRLWKSHSSPYFNEIPEVQDWLDYKTLFFGGGGGWGGGKLVNGPSRLFHSSQLLGGAKTGDPQQKPPDHHKQNLACLTCDQG